MRHRFLPAGDDDVGVAIGDLLHAERHGAQARAAELIELQAVFSCGTPAFIAACRAGFWPWAGGQDLPQDHLVDLARLDLRPLDSCFDRGRAKIMRRSIRRMISGRPRSKQQSSGEDRGERGGRGHPGADIDRQSGPEPRRQAAMKAGVPQEKTAWNCNRLCG